MILNIDIKNKKITVEADEVDVEGLMEALEVAVDKKFREQCTVVLKPVNNPMPIYPTTPIPQNPSPWKPWDPMNPYGPIITYCTDKTTHDE